MPEFVRIDPTGNREPVLVRHSDLSPIRIEAEYPIDEDRALPKAMLSGYGAVEIKLTTLLRGT
jgi:hypothetical protein